MKPLATYEFPVQAVTKARPRQGRGGRFYTPRSTRDFEALVAGMAMSQVKGDPLEGPIGLIVHFHMEKDRGDIDNLQKALFDGLQGVVYRDDRQIRWVAAIKRKSDQSIIKVKVFRGESEPVELFGKPTA